MFRGGNKDHQHKGNDMSKSETLGEVVIVKDSIADVVSVGGIVPPEPCLDCEESGRSRRRRSDDHDRSKPLDRQLIF